MYASARPGNGSWWWPAHSAPLAANRAHVGRWARAVSHCAPCFTDWKLRPRGQRLDQPGAQLGFRPRGQAPGPGSMLTLEESPPPPPQGRATPFPSLTPSLWSPPGALGVQVMSGAHASKGPRGWAGRRGRSRLIARGALQPSQGGPESTCPHPAPGPPAAAGAPTLPVSPLLPGQAHPRGPGLSIRGRGQPGAEVSQSSASSPCGPCPWMDSGSPVCQPALGHPVLA